MNGTVPRRFAIAVTTDLPDALTIAQKIVQSDLHPQQILIVGQERSFTNTTAPCAIGKLDWLRVDSSRIISLACDIATVTNVVAPTPNAFGDALQRYLPLSHARRLSGAISDGKFLVFAEIRSMKEERSATRVLLQTGGSIVEVHDLHLPVGERLP